MLIRLTAFHSNHIFRRYNPTIWLVGDGRSGTTWVSNLINHDKYFREVFEPFHPEFIKQMNFFSSHYYSRPNEKNEKLRRVCDDVFSGKLWNSRTDGDNSIRLYKGLFIKDIFSNLSSNWVYYEYPNIRIILLIRNPFAVASSKYNKKEWTWVTDPMTLYNQTSLREDYLLEHEDLIKRISKEGDYILKQILIWSIIHHVPLRQFNSNQISIMFYENVFLNPVTELSELSKVLDKDFEMLPKEVIQKPSRAVGENIKKGKSPIDSWLNDLSSKTIDTGMKILEEFGLDSLYDSKSIPNEFDIDRY